MCYNKGMNYPDIQNLDRIVPNCAIFDQFALSSANKDAREDRQIPKKPVQIFEKGIVPPSILNQLPGISFLDKYLA